MTATSGSVQFDFGALLKQAWQLFVANAGLLLGAYVLLGLIGVIAGSLSMQLANLVLAGPFSLGLATICLKTARGQQVEFAEAFSGFQRFPPAFMANLLMLVFTTIGLVLFILPGIFVMIIYMFTYFCMCAENLDFWPAMERSRTMVMANIGPFILLFFIVIAIGAIACGIGLFVSLPVTVLLIALVYDQAASASSFVSSDSASA